MTIRRLLQSSTVSNGNILWVKKQGISCSSQRRLTSTYSNYQPVYHAEITNYPPKYKRSFPLWKPTLKRTVYPNNNENNAFGNSTNTYLKNDAQLLSTLSLTVPIIKPEKSDHRSSRGNSTMNQLYAESFFNPDIFKNQIRKDQMFSYLKVWTALRKTNRVLLPFQTSQFYTMLVSLNKLDLARDLLQNYALFIAESSSVSYPKDGLLPFYTALELHSTPWEYVNGFAKQSTLQLTGKYFSTLLRHLAISEKSMSVQSVFNFNSKSISSNIASQKYVNIDAIIETLNRIKYETNNNPTLHDLNIALSVLVKTKGNNELLEKTVQTIFQLYTPNVETAKSLLCLLKTQKTSMTTVVDTIQSMKLLNQPEIQILMVNHVIEDIKSSKTGNKHQITKVDHDGTRVTITEDEFVKEKIATNLNNLSIAFHRHGIIPSEEFTNRYMQALCRTGRADQALLYLNRNTQIIPHTLSKMTTELLLYSVGRTTIKLPTNQKHLFYLTLWKIVSANPKLNLSIIKLFINLCLSDQDYSTHLKIHQYLSSQSIERQQTGYKFLFETLNQLPKEYLRKHTTILLKSEFANNKTYWTQLFNAIQDPASLPTFLQVISDVQCGEPSIPKDFLIQICLNTVTRISPNEIYAFEQDINKLLE
ncbi:hypothetical protein HDV02_002711 [Globomyces sp. JEL0801]|nr:hypothetical protein HDV02_002711 [Globomyces sp. JEL0801]